MCPILTYFDINEPVFQDISDIFHSHTILLYYQTVIVHGLMCVCAYIHTQRDRQRDRETVRQQDSETDRDRQTDRLTDGQTYEVNFSSTRIKFDRLYHLNALRFRGAVK